MSPHPLPPLQRTGRGGLPSGTEGEHSAAVRAEVEASRTAQAERFVSTGLLTNADMGPRELGEHAALDAAGDGLL